ncbi:hypothetical protein FIBSPDRAFT_870140 [Athelia psychrophila]|uniref:Uncharacterized protein n=1 Tax=Athelia psychrophila TaxID=1759441 RepID=A0A166BBP6_9AGAM|nr:hypothetical protein FIBSPDRAFT_873948 [Fibularhizoctonia sp. CBS 109695]KZP12477.1 hypothetical protein FIBSPDRAFT_870140 [Fibularhizoctonia sp. CBS 109695]
MGLTGPIAAVPKAEMLLTVTVVATRFGDYSWCEQRAGWEGGMAILLPLLSRNPSLSASPLFHLARGGIGTSQESR